MTIYYTGRGDKGTSIMGAKKVSKADPLFEVLGTLDELNSWLGICKYKPLKPLQEDLFIAQAEIALAAMGRKKNIKYQITNDKTKRLEEEIIKIDKILPPIKKFIIPGGSELSAKLDFARALARRAERALARHSLARRRGGNNYAELLQYLNRLSSILFAHARLVNYTLKVKENNPSYK